MLKKAILSTLVLSLVVAGFSGCGKPADNAKSSPLPSKINEVGNAVKDIGDMPDWTGDKLKLSLWIAQGTNAPNIGKAASNDVFRAELERVTGISLDTVNSIDNNGSSADARIAKIIASNSWPDLGIQLSDSMVERLAREGIIYDLTDVVPQYATNYMSIINSSEKLKTAFEELKLSNGRRYVWAAPYKEALKTWDKNYNEKQYSRMFTVEDTRTWIWVRDDILKKIRPNAKTMQEIKDAYVAKGMLSKEDLSDVTIKSPEEFKDFLTDIKNLNLVENGRKVYPFYTHAGGDNWNIMMLMTKLCGAGPSVQPAVTYFSYFDVEQGKLVPTVKQPWFKEITRYANQLVREGMASREALIDNVTAFEQKKNNGQYAVIYGTNPPSDDVLKAGGKNYSYRKVMIDIPMNTKRFVSYEAISKILGANKIAIFNKKIKPSQLEQVIRFLDFFYSDAGMKFTEWGPKKAGLYTENADNTRVYNDKKLENYKLRGTDSDVMIKYGFDSWPPIVFAAAPNKYSAKILYPYSKQPLPEEWSNAWNYGNFEKPLEYPMIKRPWEIYTWASDVPGIKKFWDSRQLFEDSLKLIFTATNDSEFESYYNKMVNIYVSNGLDDKTFEEYNQAFAKENKEYMDGLLKWRK